MSKAKKHIIAICRATKEQSQAIIKMYADKAHILFLDTNPFPDNEAKVEPLREANKDHPVLIPYSDSDINQIMKDVKGAHVSLVGSMSGENTTTRLIAMAGAAYMFKHQKGAKSVSMHLPYGPFMRADKESVTIKDGSARMDHRPIMAGFFAANLAQNADAVYMIDPHSQASKDFFKDNFGDSGAHFLSSAKQKADEILRYVDRLEPDQDGDGFFIRVNGKTGRYVQENGRPVKIDKIVVGAPDGANKPDDMAIRHRNEILEILREKWPEKVMGRSLPLGVFEIEKTRTGIGKNISRFANGNVQQAMCFIIDDMIGSGGTQLKAAEILSEQGSAYNVAVVTHGIFPPKADKDGLDNFINKHEHLDELVTLDTVTRIYERVEEKPKFRRDFIHVVSAAPLILEGIDMDRQEYVAPNPSVPAFVRNKARDFVVA